MNLHHRRNPAAARMLRGDSAADVPARSADEPRAGAPVAGVAPRNVAPIAPEIALVLAAATFPADAAAIVETRRAAAMATDWTAALAFARRHRISALVAHGFAAAGVVPPAEIAAELDCAVAESMRGEIGALAETRRLEAELAAAGIVPILIKGHATALLAFGRAGLRHARDIDFLVRDGEVDRAAATLAAMGYVRAEPAADASAGEVAAWRRAHKDMVFAHPERRTIVELHWRLFDNPHLLPGLAAAPAIERRIGNMTVRTLPADANLLYLCMHGAQHAWSRLKWLADVNAILARGGPHAAAQLFALADRRGARRAAGQAIVLCGYLFGLDVPGEVIAEVRRDRQLRWLVRVALSSAIGGAARELEERPFGSTWKNVAHYWLADGWRYRAAEAWFDLHDVSAALVPAGLRWTGPAARPLAWLLRRSRGLIVPRTS